MICILWSSHQHLTSQDSHSISIFWSHLYFLALYIYRQKSIQGLHKVSVPCDQEIEMLKPARRIIKHNISGKQNLNTSCRSCSFTNSYLSTDPYDISTLQSKSIVMRWLTCRTVSWWSRDFSNSGRLSPQVSLTSIKLSPARWNLTVATHVVLLVPKPGNIFVFSMWRIFWQPKRVYPWCATDLRYYAYHHLEALLYS